MKFTPLPPEAVCVYDAAERLVAKLGSWELEDSKGPGVVERISEERIRKMRGKCKEMTSSMLAKEPGLEDVVVKCLGGGGKGMDL